MQNQLQKIANPTKAKNFAQTDFVRHSGPGSDMLSRNGQSTINYYKVFQQSLLEEEAAQNINKESSNIKHKKLLKALAFVPEEVFNEQMLQSIHQKDIEELGKIAMQGKQQLIINKLESIIDNQLKRDILEAKPRSDSQIKNKDEKNKEEKNKQ